PVPRGSPAPGPALWHHSGQACAVPACQVPCRGPACTLWMRAITGEETCDGSGAASVHQDSIPAGGMPVPAMVSPVRLHRRREMSIVLNRVALKGVAWILGIGGMLAAGQAAFASGTGGIGTEDRNLLENRVFDEGHPDLKWRVEAIRAMEKGRKREAFELFKRAASYADKPSQAMVAEMYWTGTGALRNRPLAYAWMDLAAERGYTKYLARREYIW